MKKNSGEIIVIKRDKSVKERKSSISIPNSVLQVQAHNGNSAFKSRKTVP